MKAEDFYVKSFANIKYYPIPVSFLNNQFINTIIGKIGNMMIETILPTTTRNNPPLKGSIKIPTKKKKTSILIK